MAATRVRISLAALLVKVTARILSAATPSLSRYTTRAVITRVFPVPAPARIRTGPRVVLTASSCCGLRSKRLAIDFLRKFEGRGGRRLRVTQTRGRGTYNGKGSPGRDYGIELCSIVAVT